MKRVSVFFIVDVIAFALFAFLATTGVLVRYVLPPGSGHFSALWGMDRHEWGSIHFWMAMTLMGVLALHLVFHWRWIVSMVCGRPRAKASGLRIALACVGLIAFVGLAASPFLSPVRALDDPPPRERPTRPRTGLPETIAGIDGRSTISRLALAAGVPAADIIKRLGLPADTPTDEPLGRLRRIHGFELEDVRAVVRDLQEVREPE